MTPTPGSLLASVSLGPGRPAEGGALTPDAISGPPSDLADMPAGSEGGRFDVGPVPSPSSEPVSLPPRRQTKPGISYGPDGVPTLPADSPYTVVRREMLSRLERPHRTGLPVLVGGGAGLVLLGVILGFGAARMTAPTVPEPTSPPRSSAAAPRAEAPSPAPAPATEPTTAPSPATPAAATAVEPREAAPTAAAPATPEKPAEDSTATPAPRHAAAGRPKPAATRPATPPAEPKPAAAAAPKPEPIKPVAGIPAKLAEVRKLLGLKDYRQVVVICADVLKEDPRNTTAYKSLGVAYSGLGARPQACESYRRYLRLAPDAPDKDQIEAILGACN